MLDLDLANTYGAISVELVHPTKEDEELNFKTKLLNSFACESDFTFES